MLKLGKGWRKWLMIGFLAILGGLAILAFTTGCSSKAETTTATPLQGLQTDVAAVKARLDTLDDSVFQNSNSLSVLETWKTGIETWKASVNEQITTLQTGGTSPDVTGNITSIEARLTFLEMQWEGMVNPTPTPTATLSGSPTATPTPTVMCGVQRPTLTTPAYGSTINAGTVNFQWNTCANADHYEFYLGITPDVTNVINISSPFHSIQYPASTTDTYYYWKVVSVSPCGDKSQSDGWWFKTLP